MVGNFHSNDDLFPDDKAREVAERAYPLISFALHHEAATNLFRTIDAKAKHAKRRFGILGLLVVALAFFSLSLAAIEPGLLAPAELNDHVLGIIAGIAAFAGILSFSSHIG